MRIEKLLDMFCGNVPNFMARLCSTHFAHDVISHSLHVPSRYVLFNKKSQESDLDEEFGAVVAGDISGVIDIHTQVNRIESYEISVSSSFDMVKLWLSCFCPTHNSLFLSLKSHPVLPPTLCLHYTHTFFHFSLRL